MRYNIRTIRPELTEWCSVEANSPEETTSEYQDKFDPPYISYHRETETKGIELIRLCCIEVEGHYVVLKSKNMKNLLLDNSKQEYSELENEHD